MGVCETSSAQIDVQEPKTGSIQMFKYLSSKHE